MLRRHPALESCLVRDSAHVTLGAKGAHVSAIQKALLLLDRGNVPVVEMYAQVYGPGTAAAVLEYKRKRRIINHSYQSAPDNIVGKMTIARLDEEMFVLESRGSYGRTGCRGNAGDCGPLIETEPAALGVVGGAAKKRPSTPAPAKPVPVIGGRVSIVLQVTTAADALGNAFPLMVNLMNRAAELMAPHGVSFSGGKLVLPQMGPAVPDAEQVIYGSPASTFSVRAAAEKVMPGLAGSLRVIFCPFTEQSDAFGFTERTGTVGTQTFPIFCLINVRKANADHGTLLHEMVHACRPHVIPHDNEGGGTDNTSVFAAPTGVPRDHLPPSHAAALADSFFGFRGGPIEIL